MVDDVVINGVEYSLSPSTSSSMATRNPLSCLRPNNELLRDQLLSEKRPATVQCITADVQKESRAEPSAEPVLPNWTSFTTLLQPQAQANGVENKVAMFQNRPINPSLPWHRGFDQAGRFTRGNASAIFPASAMYFISVVANTIPCSLSSALLPLLFLKWLTLAARFFSSGASTGGNQASLSKIFDKYREDAAGEPDHVGVDGTMKYLADIGVDIEGLESLAALEIVQAPAMGEMSREGFVKGWSALSYVAMSGPSRSRNANMWQ